MMQYIYDFLSIFFDKLKDKSKINSIMLFGSHARGNQRKDSDIDIFIDVDKDNKKEIDEIAKESLNEFELKASKSWHLKGMNNAVSLIIDDINLDKWKELKKEMSIYGIALYNKYSPENKSSKALISYDISGLKQKDKMKLLRRLQGYKIIKGKKTYSQDGLIKKINGEKISNALIIDSGNKDEVANLFRKNKVPVRIRLISI